MFKRIMLAILLVAFLSIYPVAVFADQGPQISEITCTGVHLVFSGAPANASSLSGWVSIEQPSGNVVTATLKYSGTQGNNADYWSGSDYYSGSGFYTATKGMIGTFTVNGLPQKFQVGDCKKPTAVNVTDFSAASTVKAEIDWPLVHTMVVVALVIVILVGGLFLFMYRK